MSIELQNIDCNCNNCKHLIRDSGKYNKSVLFHKKIQLEQFNRNKEKGFIRPNAHFQFDKSKVSLFYGDCSKLNKSVSFIPNTCQLDTQDCFENRKQNEY